MSSTPPPPISPGGPPATRDEKDPRPGGVLKWGLVGCAGLSVLLIVGMVLFLRKAPQLMESLLGATESQVVSAIAADVPAAEREAFRTEYAAFVETAKAGKAKPDDIQGLQKKIVAALEDRTVSGEELKGLTEHLRSMPKK
ncbi:MAG TPA: hypothetical protein PLP50_09755 [Thermoanaerobaculia bacterium]|jgi:hypothetical protein|nr:hypothetical protein [Thermoanaerobaculia bacterium]HPA51876.1 hypothetical protein [Thermoanaerobaculia bacterium]HQN07216.1 hypothetical protein [Thermoanaerobaculia bacterium]HQP85842.1 hypothetical protein [Thermoanaerobaculia bacterium]